MMGRIKKRGENASKIWFSEVSYNGIYIGTNNEDAYRNMLKKIKQ
jgi:hypothetical protein